ncbi:MAG: SufE family protein [Pirellulaceae bacterium]
MNAGQSAFPPTLQSIETEFESMEDWDERYEFLVELGRELPSSSDEFKTPERVVKGCMSHVWMATCVNPSGHFEIQADSDSLIVKGLLVILISALASKTSAEVLAFDTQELFDRLGLSQHLSANRRNGLHAMVARIRQLAFDAETPEGT